MFVADSFTQFMKILVLVASGLAVIMSREFFKLEGDNRFELCRFSLLHSVLVTLAQQGYEKRYPYNGGDNAHR